MKHFKFELNAKVESIIGKMSGIVTGRSEYSNSENAYLVLYADRGGYPKKEWITESELTPFVGPINQQE